MQYGFPTVKPDKANLSEDQVIRKALMSEKAGNINIFVITGVSYSEQLDKWTIRFKDGFVTDKEMAEHSLEVVDVF